jgi:hypothetical protein
MGSGPKAHPPLAESPILGTNKMKGSQPEADPPSAKKLADRLAENPALGTMISTEHE